MDPADSSRGNSLLPTLGQSHGQSSAESHEPGTNVRAASGVIFNPKTLHTPAQDPLTLLDHVSPRNASIADQSEVTASEIPSRLFSGSNADGTVITEETDGRRDTDPKHGDGRARANDYHRHQSTSHLAIRGDTAITLGACDDVVSPTMELEGGEILPQIVKTIARLEAHLPLRDHFAGPSSKIALPSPTEHLAPAEPSSSTFTGRAGNCKVTCRTQQYHDAQHTAAREVMTRSIQLGVKLKLLRWVPGTILRFYFDGESFGDIADVVLRDLIAATQTWTQHPGIDISFERTFDKREATFRVTRGISRSADDLDLLGLAFFPNNNAEDRSVYIYDLALSDEYIKYLTKIFCHELGHVLGLRHDFIDPGWPSVRFPRDAADYVSIMGRYPETDEDLAAWDVHDLDRQNLREYMAFTGTHLVSDEGERFNKAPDYDPTPMTFPRRAGSCRRAKNDERCCFQ